MLSLRFQMLITNVTAGESASAPTTNVLVSPAGGAMISVKGTLWCRKPIGSATAITTTTVDVSVSTLHAFLHCYPGLYVRALAVCSCAMAFKHANCVCR